ncbi:MAG: chemotaxis protein [Pirellulaceae bacterium]|nr:chemotaxis protein [Pirellulaceae bacterium]
MSSNLELLHSVFSAATHDASAAMSFWTKGLVTLSLDEVRELPLEEVVSSELEEKLLNMVVLTLDEESGGTIVLTFDDNSGRQLASILLSQPLPEEGTEWNELEKSALLETGNILGCAYIGAIAKCVEQTLTPSPPYFLQDYAASVLEQAIIEQATYTEKILICQTRFLQKNEEVNWNVFFIPSFCLRQKMEQSLQFDEKLSDC